ncbi:MAG: RusA family crossover junction endodeoxyribonuclease [Candidatus Micrarchaeia archaeon]
MWQKENKGSFKVDEKNILCFINDFKGSVKRLLSDDFDIEEVGFEINIEPRPKQRPRIRVSNKRLIVYTQKEAKAYEDQLRYLILEKIEKKDLFITQPVFVINLFLIPRKKSSLKKLFVDVRPDLDNYEKLIIDVLQKTILSDDKLIFGSFSLKIYSNKPGIHTWLLILSPKK